MDRPLNATAASLLGFLHSGPKTGWDLVATAQREIGDFWSITQSQVYRELTAMAEAGLVEAGERGRRDSRPYAITDKGREAFAAWAAQPPGAELIRFPLLLTIVFGEHVPPETLSRHIAHHRDIHAVHRPCPLRWPRSLSSQLLCLGPLGWSRFHARGAGSRRAAV